MSAAGELGQSRKDARSELEKQVRIFSDQRTQTLRIKERAGEHAGPVWMWKALQVSRFTFNKQREIKAAARKPSERVTVCITVPVCTANPI